MNSELDLAETALSRGDYVKCLDLLKPLTKIHSLSSPEGAKIKMIMVTALMGQGKEKQAVSICRLLMKCNEPSIRQNAKQLLSVLEAPSLQRPANWSIQIPKLTLESTKESSYLQTNSSSKRKETTPILPPTGPTRALGIGFSTFVIIILSGLMFLLSGCVRITTEIDISGPDKIGLNWEIKSESQKLLPWQIQFEDSLKKKYPDLIDISSLDGLQRIKAPILDSSQADLLLKDTFSIAGELAGIDINEPELYLKETNWLIGVYQELILTLDLTDIPKIPGINFSVLIKPIPLNRDFSGDPNLPKKNINNLKWDLSTGELNKIKIHNWSWHNLGLGFLVASGLLVITLLLQKIRLQLGFGFPELPP